MTGEQIRQARDLLTLPGNSISSIARLLGVSRSDVFAAPFATGSKISMTHGLSVSTACKR